GNPPIMEKWVEAPRDVWEFLLAYPWPISWAYWMLALLAIFALVVVLSPPRSIRPPGSRGLRPSPFAPRPSPIVFLPVIWLAWQCLSATHSVDPELSRGTIKHFAGCVACFYLGFFALRREEQFWPLCVGIVAGLGLVLVVGFEQHFGGLAETRRY